MINKTVFICQKCGFESVKWTGQCSSCGSWNSLVETPVNVNNSSFKGRSSKLKKLASQPIRLTEVSVLRFARTKTGISELDRVLGGGIVPGSVVLLAGEPGMGKSTLLTQLAIKLSNEIHDPLVYVCGEESPSQVKLRLERLIGSHQLATNNFFLLPETNVENIIARLKAQKAKLVVVDSIQTLWTETLSGLSGSVGQIRETTNLLTEFAKSFNVAVFLVGHVTKEGMIAGPKILEHMVDTVLYLEGDKNYEFRILRAVKNRFGPTDEVGVFIMAERGMLEVKNPSEAFIENPKINKAGSCTVVTMQGLRPVLVEIQALSVKSQLPVPRRLTRGVDNNRLQILCAVLQKNAGIPLYNQDIFLSVAGGLHLSEPAIDFGICLAVASSYKNKALPEKSVAVGEVGLLGELRKVSFLEKRIKQAKALGYTRIISPRAYLTVTEAIRKLL